MKRGLSGRVCSPEEWGDMRRALLGSRFRLQRRVAFEREFAVKIGFAQ